MNQECEEDDGFPEIKRVFHYSNWFQGPSNESIRVALFIKIGFEGDAFLDISKYYMIANSLRDTSEIEDEIFI